MDKIELASLLTSYVRLIVEENKNGLNINDFKVKLRWWRWEFKQFKVTMIHALVIKCWWRNRRTGFLCRLSSIPFNGNWINVAQSSLEVEILRLVGDRTIEAWTVTVYNDTNFKLRDAFERWIKQYKQYE